MEKSTEDIKSVDEIETDDNRTLEEIISDIAKEEGMTYEETMKLFKQGMKMMNGVSNLSPKEKAKRKAKRKASKKARKKNRK